MQGSGSFARGKITPGVVTGQGAGRDIACSVDTVDIEYQSIPNTVGLVVADFLFKWQKPYRTFFLASALGAGSIRLWIHFTKLGLVDAGGGLIAITGGEQFFPLSYPTAGGQWGWISFCKPVTQFLISGDNGGALQPLATIGATNDFDYWSIFKA